MIKKCSQGDLMKRIVLLLLLVFCIPLYSAEVKSDPFIGSWDVVEDGYSSTMTFSNGFLTWESEAFGPRVYKYELVQDEDESSVELRYDNSSSMSLKILKVTKDEIYLSRDDGRIMKLSRLY